VGGTASGVLPRVLDTRGGWVSPGWGNRMRLGRGQFTRRCLPVGFSRMARMPTPSMSLPCGRVVRSAVSQVRVTPLGSTYVILQQRNQTLSKNSRNSPQSGRFRTCKGSSIYVRSRAGMRISVWNNSVTPGRNSLVELCLTSGPLEICLACEKDISGLALVYHCGIEAEDGLWMCGSGSNFASRALVWKLLAVVGGRWWAASTEWY
jgi:hypothetical protein